MKAYVPHQYIRQKIVMSKLEKKDFIFVTSPVGMSDLTKSFYDNGHPLVDVNHRDGTMSIMGVDLTVDRNFNGFFDLIERKYYAPEDQIS